MAVGDLVANLTANTAGWSKGLNSARSQMGGFVSGTVSQLARIGLAFQGVSAIGSVFRSIGGGATGLVQLAAEAEQTAISFEVMLGSADKATAMIAEMRAFAAKTPLETKDIQDAGRTLMQFGVDGQNVMPMLKMIGDVTGGNSERFKSMSLAMAQVSAAGRLQGQDLLQMVNAGFNPLKIISEQTGQSMADLKKKMEDGAISTQMVVGAFQSATGAGGQFHGMMDRQSKTTAGLFSSLRDNVMLAGTDIGKALIEGFNLNGLMGDATSFLEMFRSQWLPGVVTTINTMGQAFGRVVEFFRNGWGEWLANSMSSLVDFMANFDLYWQIAQQTIVMWASNGILQVQDFFTNVHRFINWWSDAWAGAFTDILSASGTFFTNLLKGQEAAQKALMDLASGKSIAHFAKNLDWLDAFDGFESSIRGMPALVKTELAKTMPELDALYKELGERQSSAAAKAMAATPAPTLTDAMTPFDDSSKSGGKKKAGKTLSGAAEFGSKDALSIIANASARGKDPVEKNTKGLLDESKKHTGILESLVDVLGDFQDVSVVELPA